MWGTQQALYAALKSASPTIAGGRVFDDVPPSVQFPYVAVGESVAAEQDVDGLTGVEETVTLYIYSRERGQREIKQIAELIKAALHKQSLTIAGSPANCFWAGSLTRLDPDGLTRQAIIRIRVSHYQEEEV